MLTLFLKPPDTPGAVSGDWPRCSYSRQSPRTCERVLLANSRRRTLIIRYHTSTGIPLVRSKTLITLKTRTVRTPSESGPHSSKHASRVLGKRSSSKLRTSPDARRYKSETLSNLLFSANPTAAVRLFASNLR